ncbi:tetratricopeptide repeat protein [Microvirga sp. BT689]|uniref:tetratricopeptide repeat protein n=1 Tax=Microvirga arvi TaxID=2778731 RepID=UPI00194EF6AB|nr:tetratricopeptide repeat protein [Microvirga arvi]MBM6583662.1 tetratricopeptide repeat protein [Microvirga arvi]
MRKLEQIVAIGLLMCTPLILAACNSSGSLSSFGNGPAEIALPDHVEPYPDTEVLRVAKIQFSEGNYGHAARYYERAVEVSPNNPEAWLGLAASYDRVRRFDLADRAYREAGNLIGNTLEYYNNIGYSHLLRGDPAKARVNFLKAHDLDPSNLTVNNNLDLLRDNIK